MRAPKIRAKLVWGGSLRLTNLKKKVKSSGCLICKHICIDDEQNPVVGRSHRLTRNEAKKMMKVFDHKIIIYETYRCMPLLGDEKIHAPDWEQHIVRFHVVLVKKNT